MDSTEISELCISLFQIIFEELRDTLRLVSRAESRINTTQTWHTQHVEIHPKENRKMYQSKKSEMNRKQ